MIDAFASSFNPARIVFGRGAITRLAEEIRRLGCSKALILSTPVQLPDAQDLASRLGPLSGGVFSRAAMHTPVNVTEEALAQFGAIAADCVVSFGGGSTIGLGKAIAWRNDTRQIVVATTYAGSEVTPILGETEAGLKITKRDPRILPETVIYDPDLTLGLPVPMSVASGLNAIAHAVEALYAQDRNPISSLQAAEGIRALQDALPRIMRRPDEPDARTLALYGSWLCGTVLGTVGMALHHKLCHTLGGSFDLPHAETHAILLPHSVAYNALAAQQELRPLIDLFGPAPAAGLYDFAQTLHAPQALRDLGLAEIDLDKAADIAVTNPYWNPRPIERAAIRDLLQHAWEGSRPSA